MICGLPVDVELLFTLTLLFLVAPRPMGFLSQVQWRCLKERFLTRTAIATLKLLIANGDEPGLDADGGVPETIGIGLLVAVLGHASRRGSAGKWFHDPVESMYRVEDMQPLRFRIAGDQLIVATRGTPGN